MSDTEISEVGDCITVGFNDVATGRILLSSHLRLELQQMMSRVRPEDLSAAEIAALLDILTPADSRVVGGPASAMTERPRVSRRVPERLISLGSESIDAPLRSPVNPFFSASCPCLGTSPE